MPGMPCPRRTTVALTLTAWAAVASLSAPASAEPPAAEDFQIYYYVSDENGDKDRRMTIQDLQQFVNQARCECNQNIYTDVTLQTSTGQTSDPVQLTPMVGTRCDEGQSTNGSLFRCAQFAADFSNRFTNRNTYEFAPIWLGSPVSALGPQGIDTAKARFDCTSAGQGAGGMWICAEENDQAGCQDDELLITGTQNNNVPDGQDPQGITFDFQPPIQPPSEFNVSIGDGAVELSWELGATADIAGYRILCAEDDGTAVPGKGFDGVGVTREHNGTIYFTAENLCPDGPFDKGPDVGEDDTGTTGGTGGSTTGDSMGTTGGTAGTTGGAADSTGGFDTGLAGTTSGTTAGGTTGGDPALQNLMTLHWDYVCSGHIPSTTTKGRVSGLENDRPYKFLVVAYDQAGNPSPSPAVLTAIPKESFDLWENCEQAGNTCGDAGFCSCRSDRELDPVGVLLSLGVLGFAFTRRRAA